MLNNVHDRLENSVICLKVVLKIRHRIVSKNNDE